MKQFDLIDVDVFELDLNDLYTTRSAEAVSRPHDLCARNLERKGMKDRLTDALKLGKKFEQPIITAIVEGKRVVLDGHLRVTTALKFNSKKHKTSYLIQAKCFGEITQREAFFFAQNMNVEHGLPVLPEALRHIQLRQHILENKPIGSVRELAREFNLSSPTSGSSIQKCLEWCLPFQNVIQQFMDDGKVEEAISFLSETIKSELLMSGTSCKTLGIPSAGQWARAINLFNEDIQMNEDDMDEKRIRQNALVSFQSWLGKHDIELLRYVLTKTPKLKSAAGISVAREYDKKKAQEVEMFCMGEEF
ncbi:hypothetical protein [Vibrio algivorus]|uniref:Chromosome partitioning protein ParB n=1 Tax=Vibrio algivorus TaxID=1667024 RepID=A0ABQ6EQV9_9VIBR|nr:hypothetical protein [Vibrio algivorus]GLT15518.1 hypothetical protein GCM10007931_24930 [Vibrio algivorus]